MRRRPPRSTRTDTLCPYTTLFRSQAPVLQLAYIFPARRDAEAAVIGIIRENRALQAQYVNNSIGRIDAEATACRRNPLACFDIGRSTEAFVPMGIIPDQSDRKCIVRLIQRLSAQTLPVEIIGVLHLRAARADKVKKNLALHINAVQADCQILRYRTSN